MSSSSSSSSSSSRIDISIFEEIERIFIPYTFLDKLKRKGHMPILTDSIVSNNNYVFAWIWGNCNSNKLYRYYFTKEMSIENLFNTTFKTKDLLTLITNSREGKNNNSTNNNNKLFLYSFANIYLDQVRTPYERNGIIRSWITLHLRSITPSDASITMTDAAATTFTTISTSNTSNNTDEIGFTLKKLNWANIIDSLILHI